jgi:hypothetical protein
MGVNSYGDAPLANMEESTRTAVVAQDLRLRQPAPMTAEGSAEGRAADGGNETDGWDWSICRG